MKINNSVIEKKNINNVDINLVADVCLKKITCCLTKKSRGKKLKKEKVKDRNNKKKKERIKAGETSLIHFF